VGPLVPQTTDDVIDIRDELDAQAKGVGRAGQALGFAAVVVGNFAGNLDRRGWRSVGSPGGASGQ
jgi:hypothetical protein